MSASLFEHLPADDLAGFAPAARLDELRRGKMKRVEINGAPVLLAVLDNPDHIAGIEVVAFTALCPHALGDLSYGALDNGEVDCPDHGYRFDVRSGACVFPKLGPSLRTYPVRVLADGTVLVKVERPKWMSPIE
ncbi:MAG: Rieske (2Fe-2S) protein [Anaerolineae bacterium]|nr:Rieske (2Fe-2S) protein [Thermoflexales bacterium]MDW8408303.1 Rieske (2Fe-2S) protein [Anaerolineae bacterium]